jgi:hypothetical protein
MYQWFGVQKKPLNEPCPSLISVTHLHVFMHFDLGELDVGPEFPIFGQK